jgi:hypothetical protein
MSDSNESRTKTALNAEQIRLILSSAKDVSASRDVFRRFPSLQQSDLTEQSQIRTNQRAIDRLVESLLTKNDFEEAKFKEILAQNGIARRLLVEKQEADAIKESSSTKKLLRLDIDSRMNAIDSLVNLTGPPKYELLNTPFLIWPTLGVSMGESSIEPSNSWAKFTVRSETGGLRAVQEEVSFYFLWENPSDKHAVINCHAYLVLNGYCAAGSDGGLLEGSRNSILSLSAYVNFYQWWNDPPTLPLFQPSQNAVAAALSTDSGGFLADHASESRYIFRGYDLSYDALIVPPHGVVEFVVSAGVYARLQDGWMFLNFESSDFDIICPAVLIAILT